MSRLINRRPARGAGLMLAALPFVLLALVYMLASATRLAENPNDKLLPSVANIFSAMARMALDPSARSGEILLWADTGASLARLGLGLGISGLLGLTLGLAIGMIPYLRSTFGAFIAALSMIPPLAILPILFIVFGLGELSKVVLIVFGVTPFILRDMLLSTGELPVEQIVKAQTLGASTWLIMLRIALPQMLPRQIESLRLMLGPAWLFLIAAEAIAATDGLGYRIFLVRRYLAMDVILPYVAWITLLAFSTDYLLALLSRRLFPWTRAGQGR